MYGDQGEEGGGMNWEIGIDPYTLPGSSDYKDSACSAGELDLIPGSGRSPGEGNGDPLHYPCLENSIDRGAWRAIVHQVAKSIRSMTE